MDVEISERWEETDENLLFVLPFVDAREAINVTRRDSTSFKTQIPDQTMLNSVSTWTTGSNWLQNATDIREFQFVVNGADLNINKIRLEGLQCISGSCP